MRQNACAVRAPGRHAFGHSGNGWRVGDTIVETDFAAKTAHDDPLFLCFALGRMPWRSATPERVRFYGFEIYVWPMGMTGVSRKIGGASTRVLAKSVSFDENQIVWT